MDCDDYIPREIRISVEVEGLYSKAPFAINPMYKRLIIVVHYGKEEWEVVRSFK